MSTDTPTREPSGLKEALLKKKEERKKKKDGGEDSSGFGELTQVIGPVVDVRFPPESVPPILNSLKITNPAISDDEWKQRLMRPLFTGEREADDEPT